MKKQKTDAKVAPTTAEARQRPKQSPYLSATEPRVHLPSRGGKTGREQKNGKKVHPSVSSISGNPEGSHTSTQPLATALPVPREPTGKLYTTITVDKSATDACLLSILPGHFVNPVLVPWHRGPSKGSTSTCSSRKVTPQFKRFWIRTETQLWGKPTAHTCSPNSWSRQRLQLRWHWWAITRETVSQACISSPFTKPISDAHHRDSVCCYSACGRLPCQLKASTRAHTNLDGWERTIEWWANCTKHIAKKTLRHPSEKEGHHRRDSSQHLQAR